MSLPVEKSANTEANRTTTSDWASGECFIIISACSLVVLLLVLGYRSGKKYYGATERRADGYSPVP